MAAPATASAELLLKPKLNRVESLTAIEPGFVLRQVQYLPLETVGG